MPRCRWEDSGGWNLKVRRRPSPAPDGSGPGPGRAEAVGQSSPYAQAWLHKQEPLLSCLVVSVCTLLCLVFLPRGRLLAWAMPSALQSPVFMPHAPRTAAVHRKAAGPPRMRAACAAALLECPPAFFFLCTPCACLPLYSTPHAHALFFLPRLPGLRPLVSLLLAQFPSAPCLPVFALLFFLLCLHR